MKNPISSFDLTGFIASTRLFGDHNKHKNLSMDMLTDPINNEIQFVVKENYQKVFSTVDLKEAIEMYNYLLNV